MPGATTARLVVCDFEMPMKLFMMPQTVPNSPTNGAGRADGRQHVGAARDAAVAGGLDAFEPRGDPLLHAVRLQRIG